MSGDWRMLQDPLALATVLWPDVRFYSAQREIIASVWRDDKTVVPAGHMLGKDFVTAFIVLSFFLTRHPCRIMTTSVDHAQLAGVLWGEMRRFIQTSAIPLDSERGGPLVVNHMHIRKLYGGEVDGLSYIQGRVAEKGEGLSGHHIAKTGDGVPRTLAVTDEASGVHPVTFSKFDEWANRQLIIGNPYECQNDFKWSVEGRPGTKDKGGDIPRANGEGYHRRVIRIRGEDSPNVQLGLAEVAAGYRPSGEMLVPGVLPYEDYVKRRAMWDEIKQCVGLDAKFYEGSQVLMFPPTWLNRAEQLADRLRGKRRKARAIGIDAAEGGDDTSMAAVDEYGVIEVAARKTPNTDDVPREALAFCRKHQCDPRCMIFDAGGGGKQHAHRLRGMGYDCRVVPFGGAVGDEPHAGRITMLKRQELLEERAAYADKRSEMYGMLRELLDPAAAETLALRVYDGEGKCVETLSSGFAIPAGCAELRHQLSVIPLTYDAKGRIKLLPKKGDDPKKCLIGLIGHSPDEADAVVLGVYGMRTRHRHMIAGSF